jgi:DNA-binding response OmpR family regulator
MINMSHFLAPGKTEGASVRSRAGPPHRILVVEDDGNIRSFNAEALRQSGYQVDTAEDGKAGWTALQAVIYDTDRYDLLITDDDMPKVTGVELVRRLRTARMELPVIMATGTLPAQEPTRSPWLHPAATLLKPYTSAELLGTVSEILPTTGSRFAQIAPRLNRQPQAASDGWQRSWVSFQARIQLGLPPGRSVLHNTVHCSQHTPLPGERRNADDLLNQTHTQNKTHCSTQFNQTNPADPNHSSVAQVEHFHDGIIAAKLEEFKVGYMEEFRHDPEPFLHLVGLVVNEAAALACSTPYPHLFLPALVDEKLNYARRWKSRQCRVGNGLNAVPVATCWEAD